MDVITQETAKDALKMSVYFEIDFLTKHCEDFLSQNLQPEVCVGVWQFARKYGLTDLEEKSFVMAIQATDKVSTKDLLALPKSMLLMLLSLQAKLSMDDVCKTILSWVDADKDARAIHLAEFLPFVSFPRRALHISMSWLRTTITRLKMLYSNM